MAHRQVVVIAEGDDELRALWVDALGNSGRLVMEFDDGDELREYLEFIALRGVQASLPDLVLTDAQMVKGLDVVRWARAQGVACPFVILGGFADERLADAAAHLGATMVLSKPPAMDAICEAANCALAHAVS